MNTSYWSIVMINKEALIVALVNLNYFDCTSILHITDVLEKIHADGNLIHAPVSSLACTNDDKSLPTHIFDWYLNTTNAEKKAMLVAKMNRQLIEATREILEWALESGASYAEFVSKMEQLTE